MIAAGELVESPSLGVAEYEHEVTRGRWHAVSSERVEAALARGLLAGEHRRGEPLVVRGRGAEIRLEPFQADAAE